ncbi:flavin reductase family protein [Massilia cavernae]|uniref:Flavin reductase n=1 Tax=Massilia cavernae TaxID=2320864 RepID=A0A418Y628_9BURK|nr:flavin reductase family protein [Massilia cavernae]RJG22711.1 flavin reductase [Massilia cavernae]
MSNFSAIDLRRAFGCFPTGVTVVTTRTGDGRRVGFTANSFTSVSMSPPLVLVCLDQRASVHESFANAPGFVVNILAGDQKETAVRFASKVADRFEGVACDDSGAGLPILRGNAAFFECVLDQAIPAGDHTILIGQVVGMDDTDAPALGYHGGSFNQLARPERADKNVAASDQPLVKA